MTTIGQCATQLSFFRSTHGQDPWARTARLYISTVSRCASASIYRRAQFTLKSRHLAEASRIALTREALGRHGMLMP